MQSKEDIEESYKNGDPWDFANNPEDQKRKDIILGHLKTFDTFVKALDLGCGSCFITKDLPAYSIYGYEISDNAASRFPERVQRLISPSGFYDLVVATGVMYEHYDWKSLLDIALTHGKGIFLTCNIKDWEVKALDDLKDLMIVEEYFPYREYTQHLRIYYLGG